MCGIFGYIGKKQDVNILLEGLGRLEYRGYDSCGISYFAKDKIIIKKEQGRIANLKAGIDALKNNKDFTVGIAHTRWATHGKPTKKNAHPHCDNEKNISIVHNGIVENFSELKDELRDLGFVFQSETDTEVIAHLISYYYSGDIKQAVFDAVKRLEGSYAVCVMAKDHQNTLIGVKQNSPLVVGVAKESYFLASDSLALVPYTDKEICLQDGQVVVIEEDEIELFDFHANKQKIEVTDIMISSQDADKGDYDHFMLKEIYEQPSIFKKLYSQYVKKNEIVLPDLNLTEAQIKGLEKIYIVACGTAYHAGMVAKYLFEKFAGIDVEIDVSSEFRYREFTLRKNSLVIAVSQSGETADTIAAIKLFKEKGAKVVSICNVLGSSLTRESIGWVHTASGPEIGVASTKAYTSQVLCFFLLSLHMAKLRGTVEDISSYLKEIDKLPEQYENILNNESQTIENVASFYSKIGCFLFLGRGVNFPTALEGALKLKELSYIPAEGYAAGEMKHGPIALIDEYRAVVCVALNDRLYEKMFSNIQEIKARKGKVFALITKGDTKIKALADEYIELPMISEALSPIMAVLPLQLIAYFIALNLGYDIDKPRNLAKSVTVE